MDCSLGSNRTTKTNISFCLFANKWSLYPIVKKNEIRLITCINNHLIIITWQWYEVTLIIVTDYHNNIRSITAIAEASNSDGSHRVLRSSVRRLSYLFLIWGRNNRKMKAYSSFISKTRPTGSISGNWLLGPSLVSQGHCPKPSTVPNFRENNFSRDIISICLEYVDFNMLRIQ